MCEYNLFICKTPFQIVTAIILQMYNFEEIKADILLTNRFNSAYDIQEKCKSLGIFEEVYLIDDAMLENKHFALKAFFSPKFLVKKMGLDNLKQYSRIFTNSLYGDIENAIYYFQKKATVILFDEGYSTYTNDFLKAIDKFSKIHIWVRKLSKLLFRRIYIDEVADEIFLYDPRLCVTEMPFHINKIWDKTTKRKDKILNNVFKLYDVEEKGKEYTEKYIFFEECFSNDFNNNNDLLLIKRITEIVGMQNLKIKLHPRDKTNRFEMMGYNTNKSTDIPTEALILGMKDKDNCFITFSSGSVLNYKFLYDFKIKTILLYKMENEHFINMPEDRKRWFEKFKELYGEDLFTPQNDYELIQLLNQNVN